MVKQHYQTRKFKSTFLLLWFFNVIFASVLLIFANTLNQSTNSSVNSNAVLVNNKKQQPMQSVPSFKYLILFIALLLFMNSLIMITMYLGKRPDFSHHHDPVSLVSLDFV